MCRASLILLLFFLANCTFAKDINWLEINRYLSRVYQEDEISNSIETLEYYFNNPISLYNAKEDALTVLPSVDLRTSSVIVSRFNKNPDISDEELFEGLLLDEAQILIILYSTTRRQHALEAKTSAKYCLRSEERFEKVSGLRQNKYLGDRYDIYQRLVLTHKHWHFQAIGNKNLGELHLFEFYSFGAKYESNKFKLFLGDFNANFGCGNLLWQGFSLGKGGDYISAAQPYKNSIKLNTSSSQVDFFRGVALEKVFNVGIFDVSTNLFFSSFARPANIDTAKKIATSIYTSNYFRTQTEIRKKNALLEYAQGANFVISYKYLNIGFTYFDIQYDFPLKSSSSRAFSGKYSNLFSTFVIINLQNATFGGEYSFYEMKYPAAKVFWRAKNDNFEIVQHYRNYHAKYRSFFGYNFGESSTAANEEGLYTGIKAKFSKNLISEAYIDFYRSHMRTYSVEKPIKGYDYTFKHTYRNKHLGEFFLKIKSEAKTDGFKPKGASNQTIYNLMRNDVRFEYERKILRNLNITFRLDATDVYFEQKKPCENGKAGFIELNYNIFSNLSLSGRISVFQTDSYSSAIWHYEYRMPTSIFSNALYDEGSRLLLRTRYSPIPQIHIYFAYTRLHKPKLDKLGSSYDQINSNKDNRIYLLLNIKL